MMTVTSRAIPQNKADLDHAGITLPYIADTSVLSDCVKIHRQTIPNRIVYQAMEGCDGTAEGRPDSLTFRRYRRFAAGGPGIIWVEATAVLEEGRANPRQLFLNPNTLDSFSRLVSAIKEECFRNNGFEPFVAVQLTHSGRYSKPNGTPAPLIAYNNPVFEGDRPLDSACIVTDDYLDTVGEYLAEGARLAQKAGFDAADIKSCHRYLLCELLSAYTRPGKYGGSFVNRTRLLRETVANAVQNCSGDFVIASRLNIYDGFPYPYGFGISPDGGSTPDYAEPKALVAALADSGLQLLNLTMGNPYLNPHVNRPFSKGPYIPDEPPLQGVERLLTGIREVTAASRAPTVCSGLSFLGGVSPHVAAACIKEGWFAFAGYGREAFAYPNIARDICSRRELSAGHFCIACSKCSELMRAGGTTGCVVRDSEEYLPLYKQYVLKNTMEA